MKNINCLIINMFHCVSGVPRVKMEHYGFIILVYVYTSK